MGLLRLFARVLESTGRVRSHRFWHAAYWLLETRAAVASAALVLHAIERARDAETAAFVLDRFATRFASGWPRQGPGWINLDVSRFVARVRRRRATTWRPAERAPRAVTEPLRIGVVGQFSGLLSFGPELFTAAIPEVEVHVFDVAFGSRSAAYLDGVASSYRTFSERRPAEVATAIDDADLDLLLVVLRGEDAYRLVALVRTPCVAFVCTGSDLLHHPAVDVQLYAQPEADYFLRGERLFCGTSRAWFETHALLRPAFLPYDRRGVTPGARRPWSEREPLVVIHGSLYKAASPRFFDLVLGLLLADPQLELVVMGKDDRHSLAWLEAHARQAGVGERMRYEGAFDPVRGDDGSVEDPRWERLADLLSRARLAPDPFPVCGATSRVEAFGLGAPSPHLTVSFAAASWGQPQDAFVEVTALEVPLAAAESVSAYEDLARRCLYDGDFAERVSAAQVETFARVTDGAAYWRQILACYADWAERRASSVGRTREPERVGLAAR